MVLTFMAFAMVIVFMCLIMTRRMSAMVALILVPLAFAIAGGFARDIGPMMLDGIRNLAPTGVMLMFAILYFAIMTDAGLFDPLVARIVRISHGDPVRITVGTAILALLVSLDGDGSTTYMITVAAMLPLYRKMGINPLMLTTLAMMAVGVTNVTPWGGPTARAATALQIDPSRIFNPMVPAMIGCAIWVTFVAYRFGLRERRRLAAASVAAIVVRQEGAVSLEIDELTVVGDGLAARASRVRVTESVAGTVAPLFVAGPAAAVDVAEASTHAASLDPLVENDAPLAHLATRRPRLLWVNALLTAALMVALVAGALPLPVLFVIAFACAMLINYPSVDEQKARIAQHAGNVLAVVGLIFAAGVFTGILSGTKMVDAMAGSVVQVIPSSMGPYLAIITALVSIPFTFFISNDAFYFGVLPILAQAAAAYGISIEQIGRASIVGQQVHLLSPLVPSTYLLVGLVKVDLGDHQRFALKWALASALVMLGVGLVTGVIPVVGAIPGS